MADPLETIQLQTSNIHKDVTGIIDSNLDVCWNSSNTAKGFTSNDFEVDATNIPFSFVEDLFVRFEGTRKFIFSKIFKKLKDK